jgi:starch synthase
MVSQGESPPAARSARRLRRAEDSLGGDRRRAGPQGPSTCEWGQPYEPFGIVNLEAMACGVPVVASRVGGIPEIVLDGETGFLVPLELAAGPVPQPADPDGFARALAERINQLLADRELAQRLGEAGRRRAVEHFSWSSVAEQTVALYRTLVNNR